MAKTWTKSTHTPATTGRGKKTSQGRGNVGTATMNKSKKANLKKYRGQGKWIDTQYTNQYGMEVIKKE